MANDSQSYPIPNKYKIEIIPCNSLKIKPDNRCSFGPAYIGRTNQDYFSEQAKSFYKENKLCSYYDTNWTRGNYEFYEKENTLRSKGSYPLGLLASCDDPPTIKFMFLVWYLTLNTPP